MSFCGKCGAKNDDDAKFCCKCGAALNNVSVTKPESQAVSNNTASEKISSIDFKNAGEALKKIPTKTIGIAGGAVAVLLIAIIFAVNHKPTIKLDNYVTFEQTGYDGYGEVSASIDWEAIEEKYGKSIKFTSKAKEDYGALLSMFTPIDALEECVDIEFEQDGGLSNGDEVVYYWDIDEDLSVDLDCKVKYKDGTVKITDLAEVGKFEAFDDIEVSFSGIAPNGVATVEYSGEELVINSYDFDIYPDSGLSNGDVISVSIPERYVQGCAERCGKVPENLEKEYTVEGLQSYVTERSQITEDAIDKMQKQGEDVYKAHAAQNFSDGEELESLTCVGDYLLTAKNYDGWGYSNIFYMVFRAQVHNTISRSKQTYDKVNDIFWYIEFDNLMVDENGDIDVDVTQYSKPIDTFVIDSNVSNGWFGTKEWYYYGYKSIDDLYENAVTTKIDSYNHEDNIDESKVPEPVEVYSNDSDYVIPTSDTEIISEDVLDGLTAEECKLARNEIYARHGRRFNDEDLQEYFDSKDWYEGTIEPDDFDESILSEIEITNKDIIVEYEEEKGYR